MNQPPPSRRQRPPKRFLATRSGMILTGILIGVLARYTLGSPGADNGLDQSFDQPIGQFDDSSQYQLPVSGQWVPAELRERFEEIKNRKESEETESGEVAPEESTGLIPPIQIPGMVSLPRRSTAADQSQGGSNIVFSADVSEQFSHDPTAAFHAHGDQVCASGCAASNHPTEELTEKQFRQLLVELTYEPMNRANNALEALLYYGPQTKQMLTQHGYGNLDRDRAEFLWRELAITHAKISIRVVDQYGEVRTWVEPTKVPFDRRHVFEMKTKNLQPLVTSGTVKRVGLDHLWTRL